MRWGVAALVLALLAHWPTPAAADDTAAIAKSLAENILGKGLVRSSRVIEDGRTVDMIWESATFKPANSAAFTRELLEIEAKFASESVFRVLSQVRGFQFEITLGKRSLCTGRVSRDRPFRIIFSKDLEG